MCCELIVHEFIWCQHPSRTRTALPAPSLHLRGSPWAPKDARKALRWLGAAAERDDIHALADLAAVFDRGQLGQAVDKVGAPRVAVPVGWAAVPVGWGGGGWGVCVCVGGGALLP